jgi:hypothetical protein
MARRKTIKEQVREMEKKQRAEAVKTVEVKVVKPKGVSKITFDQWWMIVNKKKQFKHWIKEVMKADFKARGLSDLEEECEFNKALELFGYKLP